mmetsp:Transcript_105662/g.309014  ORF Transcript_105662/g.309014 Transcript_105662/m.309014 type:complete len:250 (+) Transcript_105662:1031-1780(+)
MRTPWPPFMKVSTCSSVIGMSLSNNLLLWLQLTRAVVMKSPTPSSSGCARIAPMYSATRELCQMSSSSPKRTQTERCWPSAWPSTSQRSRRRPSARPSAAFKCWNCECLSTWCTANMCSPALLPSGESLLQVNSSKAIRTLDSSSGVDDQLTAKRNSAWPGSSFCLWTERRTWQKRSSRACVRMCAAMSPSTAMDAGKAFGGTFTAKSLYPVKPALTFVLTQAVSGPLPEIRRYFSRSSLAATSSTSAP